MAKFLRKSIANRVPAGEVPVPAQQRQIAVDDSRATALYANFCRVTGTPEEMIIDFGLNPKPFEVPSEPIAGDTVGGG